MKISPIVGSGVPAGQSSGAEGTISPSRLERAKAIAAGAEVGERAEASGDSQVDRINTRKIKMKTNLSTNRQDVMPDASAQPIVEQTLDKSDPNEPAVVAEETKPLSPQFAALMKAKRALQIEKAEFEKEKASRSQSSQSNEDLVAKLKANPLNVMLENGVTYDQLTEAIIAQQSGNTPEVTSLKAELSALKEYVGNEFSQRDQVAEQQVLSQIEKDIIQTVKENPTEYEAIREAKAEKQVKELIHRTFKKTGEILDTQQAIDLVENQLIDEALPFAKLSKVQKRLTPAEAAQVEVQLPTPKPGTRIMRTLTNRDTASPMMDKRARAIAAMQGTLKKG